MDAELLQAGFAACDDARTCGEIAWTSGLVGMLITFSSMSACFAGMRIAARWFFPASVAPFPGEAWILAVQQTREHWYCICAYYVASDRDWHNGDRFADDHGKARPVRWDVVSSVAVPPLVPPPPTAPPPQKASPLTTSATRVPPQAGGGQGPLPACGSNDDPWAAYTQIQQAKEPPAKQPPLVGLPVKLPPAWKVVAPVVCAKCAPPRRKEPPAHLMEPAPAKKMPPARKPPPANLQPPVEPPRPTRYEL